MTAPRAVSLALPPPKVPLPYECDCMVRLLGALWIAYVDFNASDDADGFCVGDMDVCIEPAEPAYAARPYRIDSTELPEAALDIIEAACARAYDAEGEPNE